MDPLWSTSSGYAETLQWIWTYKFKTMRSYSRSRSCRMHPFGEIIVDRNCILPLRTSLFHCLQKVTTKLQLNLSHQLNGQKCSGCSESRLFIWSLLPGNPLRPSLPKSATRQFLSPRRWPRNNKLLLFRLMMANSKLPMPPFLSLVLVTGKTMWDYYNFKIKIYNYYYNT